MDVSGKTLKWLAAGTMALAAALPARSDPVADFYAGKKMQVAIGFGSGEAYDTYARLLARFMPNHLPGKPLFVPQNMPGAGSLNAANAIFNTLPRDGTAFGTAHRFVPLMPLLGVKGPKFDPRKFTWLGSMNRENTVCIASKESGIATIEDARTREFTVGTTGAGAELTTFNATLRRLLGLKLKVVSGYKTSLEVDLAVTRGEVQGRCGMSWGTLKLTEPQWLADKSINVFLQLGLTKDPELKDVPLFGDLVTDDLDRRALELMLTPAQIGRPFFAPPDVPADRVAALRAAFDAAMADPELIAEAGRQHLDLFPVSGARMQEMIDLAYKTPDFVVTRARELVGAGAN